MPERCDGVDNDDNGIADDLDVDSDGICDCLRIATLGKPSRWGAGNVFAEWLRSRSTDGAVALGSDRITTERLAGLQVIVAQDVSEIGRAYDAAEVAALQAWVTAGGGFMTLTGFARPDERANVNALLAPAGIQYGPQPILPKSGSMTVPITSWRPHPITVGVRALGMDNGYPVVGEGTLLATSGKAGDAQAWDVLRVREVQAGRVVVWADEWITYNTEWSGRPDYQVELFWVNTIKYLTPPRQCQVPIPPRLIP